MTNSHRLSITRLFRSVLPLSQSMLIVHQLVFFEKHHGLQFVVDRMKALSLELRGKKQTSIGKDTNGLWRGPFKPFHRKALESRRLLRRCLNVLKFIHLFKQLPYPGMYLEHKRNLAEVPRPSLFFIEDFGSGNKEIGKPPPRHYAPYLGSFSTFMELNNCARLVYKNYKVFEQLPVLPPNQYMDHFKSKDIVGRCQAVMDDGSLKVRYVYAPWIALQYALEPLYWDLQRYASRIPQLFHNDQSLGKWKAWELHLDQDSWAIDLRAATDYIPSVPQFELLRQLFPHRHADIQLAADVSAAYWLCPDGTLLRHEVGQPMGTKFSFLCFSLYLYFLLKERFPEGNFAIVGDDLVVPAAGLSYLLSVGLSISYGKTLSGEYIEFCGTTIDYSGDLRIQRLKNFNDPLSVIDRFGVKGYPFFSRKVRKALKKVVNLPPPIGLGWKPRSIDRLSPGKFLELYEEPLPWTKISPFPRITASYTEDMRQLLMEREVAPTFPYRRGAFWHNFRWKQYSNLVRNQSIGRVNNLLCVIQGLNETFGDADESLLCRIYTVPSDWRSYENATKNLCSWELHRRQSLKKHHMENLLLMAKLLSAPKRARDLPPGNPKGLPAQTKLSSGHVDLMAGKPGVDYYIRHITPTNQKGLFIKGESAAGEHLLLNVV